MYTFVIFSVDKQNFISSITDCRMQKVSVVNLSWGVIMSCTGPANRVVKAKRRTNKAQLKRNTKTHLDEC